MARAISSVKQTGKTLSFLDNFRGLDFSFGFISFASWKHSHISGLCTENHINLFGNRQGGGHWRAVSVSGSVSVSVALSGAWFGAGARRMDVAWHPQASAK